ncbi:hypothetical protein R3P38DRAFT_2771080 [Favolaschia claudopus]|uniref:Uncharacterized protein n=1 Tax=Favolaschia claudopus TaxID=2862362 RepID=A0AAV9ZMV4_9AGAR
MYSSYWLLWARGPNNGPAPAMLQAAQEPPVAHRNLSNIALEDVSIKSVVSRIRATMLVINPSPINAVDQVSKAVMHPTFPRFEAVSLRIPGDPTAHGVLVYSLPGPDRKTLVALYPADSPVSAQCWQNFQSPVGFIGYVNGVVEKIKLIPLHTVPKRMTLPSSEFITSPSRITKIVCHDSGIFFQNAWRAAFGYDYGSEDELTDLEEE